MTAKQALAGRVSPVLQRMNASTPCIEASVLISADGDILAGVLGSRVDPSNLGSVSAVLLSLGERASQMLKRGKLQQVLLQGAAGSALMLRVGDDASLAVLSGPEADLGMMLMEAGRTVAEIIALGML